MSAQGIPTASHALAEIAHSVRPAGINDFEIAIDCALDWIGVALAGRRDPLSDALAAFAADSGSGTVTEMASGRYVPAACAALVNGTLAHVLDYDDVMAALPGHCGAPVVAAALSVGTATGATWGAVLNGVIAGVEVMCRLGDGFGSVHSERGWHVTATLGVFGAAAAAAVAMGMSKQQTAAALAAAALASSGLQSTFGSHGKSWQVGLAAQSGTLAALAAKAGVVVNADVIEADRGWAELYGRPRNVEWLSAAASAGKTGRARIHDTIFKQYAACFATHSAIRAAERLGLARQVPDSIEALVVEIGPQFKDIVSGRGEGGLGLKFDVAATVALVVLGEDLADPATFTDALARDHRLRSLLRRVRVECNPALDNVESVVHVADAKGWRTAHEPPPSPPNRMQRATMVRHKLRANVGAAASTQELDVFIRHTGPGHLDDLAADTIEPVARWLKRGPSSG